MIKLRREMPVSLSPPTINTAHFPAAPSSRQPCITCSPQGTTHFLIYFAPSLALNSKIMTTRSSSASSPTSSDWSDPRIDVTINAINWDVLLEIACKVHGVQQASWGAQKSGGYNLVRFLQLGDDDEKTTIVVRVPLHPEEGATTERMKAFCSRIASEVATMQYIEAHTNIFVPHVVHYDTKPDHNGVRSPYIIMTKVDGIPLSSVWNSMSDEKRDNVLRQVVDFYLELASHRFDKIGVLCRRQSEGEDDWYIEPLSFLTDPDDDDCTDSDDASDAFYSSGIDYWIAHTNAKLKTISEENFGSVHKSFNYAHTWFLRSLIPSLYDPYLDASGFPLGPGDFHSQNIFIMENDSDPQITAIIDWEFTSTETISSFAQYPLFIVDHPYWPDDHPLRARNVRDQAVFNRFMLEAERKKDPRGKQPLSRAFANCKGVYLFEQCVDDPIMFSELYPQLFAYVFGEEKEFSGDYYWALMENGILRKETKRFKREEEVWNEAKSILADEIADQNFTRSEFVKFATQHKGRFPEGDAVRVWLESVEESEGYPK